jgi:hypothetical protein
VICFSIAIRQSQIAIAILILLAAARVQAQPARSVPPSPSPFPLLDVPFVSQSEALCGGAAAAMVLRYWGERGIAAETFAPLVDQSAAGIRPTALVDDLSRRGWLVTVIAGADQAIDAELGHGRPLIALIEDRPGVYHYVVIVGATQGAVILHDPAKAPLRVVTRDEFDRRSRATGRWMAIVLPGNRQPEVAMPPPPVPAGASSCEQRVGAGVSQAQAGDLDGAERTLTTALSCPGPSALRELAGVRLLQRRWDDVAALAEQAAAIDPTDDYTWKLLGTSRFLLRQPLTALDAWNHAGEPRLDLIRINGLERTRQRPVERMLGIKPGQMITADKFVRAERAIRELPSARTSNLELMPAGQGLAELHATIAERHIVPSDVLSWAAIGVRAAVSRTVGITLGSLSGGGESLALEWRYWPGRPGLFASLRAPAVWPGTWGADLSLENQGFDRGEAELRHRGGRLVASRWLTSAWRLEVRGGVDRWNTTDALAAAGITTSVGSGGERITATIAADSWTGSSDFGAARISVTASSARRGPSGALPLGGLITSSAGAAMVSRDAPMDLWPASDTGQVRPILARAHPLLDDGRMRVERLGRRVTYASGELQYWWKAPALSRVGAAAFVDSARTMTRRTGGQVGDVDVGAGLGLASLLVPGRIRLDYAHGLRDGADALTLRYVTASW